MTRIRITYPDGQTNDIVADSAFAQALKDDGQIESFVVIPDEVVTPPPDLRITRLAFRNRFTTSEKVALELAALDDPTATTSARQQAAALRVYLKDVESATFIDLSRPDTVAGVQFLEAAGIVATGRASEILSASIEGHERPL